RAISAITIFGAERAERISAGLIAKGRDINDWNDKQWSKAMRAALGVDVAGAGHIDSQWIATEISSWARENAKLIKSIPEQLLTDVEGVVQRGVRSGEPSSEISKTIRKRFNVTKAKADLIAQDQVSKLHGQLTKARNENLDVERYVWRTGQDERVRTSHQVLDGVLCRWDDPTLFSDDDGETWRSKSGIGGFEGHPGEDFRCRCVSSPDLREILATLDK
ncbi:MAG: minor capsid protein, partial [Methylomicrobium sp.]|nr:minor capsid protein [Methylomicrobium sp.]